MEWTYVEELEWKDFLGDLVIEGMIILKWMLKQIVNM
jgi:hypothetical protein